MTFCSRHWICWILYKPMQTRGEIQSSRNCFCLSCIWLLWTKVCPEN